MDTIKLKRATKSVANASTKVLEKDEVLVVTPDSGSGKGKCQLKFGDGITAAKSLPIAIDGENADEMKVSTIPTDSDENPVLSAGETVKVFFGKIKKKFTYLENLVGNVKSVTNLFGNTDAKTVAQGLQILVNTKLSKTDKYDGVDSTSTELWATANAVRKVNEKTDNNSTSIRELNSNLMKSYDLLISSTSTTGINQVVDVDNYREILLCATHSSNGTIYNAAMIPIGLFKSTSAGSMFRCSGGSFFAQCYTANGSITASVSVDGYCAKIYGIK
ncbi:hypothetical protein [Enterocloster bolteae]|uniref:Uncharacterized protein n=3 Tax=Enterocloster bolteae TaxID=208479 RepID=R0AZI3_9FIRM|nr:hypothetical protein [Enterocloster bolteae]ENZ38164.1 hypothetical protein HMPREF1097_02750 [Enterocloster bolteae 90B8]